MLIELGNCAIATPPGAHRSQREQDCNQNTHGDGNDQADTHQNALLTVPPSTRTAAPVVEEASGLAIYATIDATSCVRLKRLISDVGRTCSKNSFSTCAPVFPCSRASCSTKSPTP